jgi:Cu/Zn superoxide dismutase
MRFMIFALFLFFVVSGASALLVPSNSSDAVNATIAYYTDPVLQKTAANPPKNTSYAAVQFTNGKRTLPDAYFRFAERAGWDSVNYIIVEVTFAFPKNLSTTNNVFAYHVHVNPVALGDNACASAGGHYDPFMANGTSGLVNATDAPNPLYHPAPGNLSTYEVGDLSGKWGILSTFDGSIAPRSFYEHYLRLSGDYSILGRSVVIHDALTNVRIACGNITLSQWRKS